MICASLSGSEGLVVREGQPKASTACGALQALRGDILKGNPPPKGALPEDNIEYSILKAKVYNKVSDTRGLPL